MNIHRPLERIAASIDWPAHDERGHRRAVPPLPCRVPGRNVVRVINDQTTGKSSVVSEWKTVQECNPRKTGWSSRVSERWKLGNGLRHREALLWNWESKHHVLDR